MTITNAEFRQNFPEFRDTTRFPEGALTYWLGWAYELLSAPRLGPQLDRAAQLYAAHNLVEERKALDEGNLGAIPGLSSGVVNNKSVDKASVGYDVTTVEEKDAGDWNLTIYGRRLYKMIQMFGMGPVQVGVGVTPIWVVGLGGGGAWPGPPCWPGWFGS